jgi:perosamine synthetase
MDAGRRFYFLEPGFNFRLTALQAGVLNVQLDRFQELWEARTRVESRWMKRLGHIATRPKPFDGLSRAPWLFTAALKSDHRVVHAIAQDLADIGVETRPVFYPLSTMPAFEAWHSHTPIANRISESGISLPTHGGVTEEWIDNISKVLEEKIA